MNDLNFWINKLYSKTILTTEPNDFFAEVHNKKKRMHLVLDENYYHDLLDDGLNEQSVNELMVMMTLTNDYV